MQIGDCNKTKQAKFHEIGDVKVGNKGEKKV